jgi:hypothetical protein
MKTLIATAFIATAAHGTGTLCTFENLPAPTTATTSPPNTGFYWDYLSSYEGFQFTSSYPQGNFQWAYYDLVGGGGWAGYDEGIVGDRALFTPWGADQGKNYRISRNELWMLNSIEVTAVWLSSTVVIEGYRYGEGVFTYTAQLTTAQRVKLNISSVYPGLLNNITEIKIYSTIPNSLSSHLAIDNIEYTVIPAPSALALLAVAGVFRRRRR